MTLSINWLTASLEDSEVDGKVHFEKEKVFFIKNLDLNPVEEAASEIEIQEQYTILRDNGCVRARLTIKVVDGELADPSYVLTTKVNNKDGSKLECESEITEDMFKSMSIVADSGMRKKRYKVEQDGYVLEFDIFFEDHDFEKGPQEWCKVDVEYADEAPAAMKIPSTYDEIIEDTSPNRDEEMQEFCEELYKEKFSFEVND